jgi:hypothetical protein
MDLHAAVTEKSKKKQEELEKQRRLEEDKDKDYLGMFYYANFVCQRSRFVCDKRNEGAIQQHKEECPWCIEAREEREAEKQARVDGFGKMRYILHMIEQKKEEIEELERKIAREKRQKLQNWEIVIERLKDDIRSAEYTIKKEQIYKHKLLNDENEITRKAANELYLEYVKMTDAEKRRRHF